MPDNIAPVETGAPPGSQDAPAAGRLAPLHALRARAGGVEGVLFDIDDTVTRDGKVEAAAYSAMWDLADAGFTLMCVTGRPLGWTDLFARIWPVRAAIGENGAGWSWREGESIREGYALADDERAAAGALLDRVRDRALLEFPEIPEAPDQRARRCDLAFDIGETHTVPRERVDGLVALIEGEGARASVSSVHAHAVPGAWNKSTGAIAAAREALKIDLEARLDRWIFIGDSGNDAAAFASFPLSVGVANVRAHLRRLPVPPAYVTEADRGRGFVEVARMLLEARMAPSAV